MAISVFDSAMYGALFGDEALSACLSDDAFIAAMVDVEAAYAKACGAVGIIDPDVASELVENLSGIDVSGADLSSGIASSGVPVPELVSRLREASGEAGHALHWGATSQDIIDTAMVLQWRKALDELASRIALLIECLKEESERYKDQLFAARTRSQVATPISFGLRIATWAQPLIAAERALPQLRESLLRVQLGGASGSLSVAGDKAAELSAAFAAEVGLADAPQWHTDRSSFLALGNWLESVNAALSKMARDLIILGRTEIAEVRAGKGGGSSTMPQKANPVAAETVISLAEYANLLAPGLSRAASPQEERDGSVWSLEWMILPQLGVATGTALGHALNLAQNMQVDGARMGARVIDGDGSIMAETASFALSAHMPRSEAQVAIKRILGDLKDGKTLAQALSGDTALGGLEDWGKVLDPRAATPAAEAMRQRIFDART